MTRVSRVPNTNASVRTADAGQRLAEPEQDPGVALHRARDVADHHERTAAGGPGAARPSRGRRRRSPGCAGTSPAGRRRRPCRWSSWRRVRRRSRFGSSRSISRSASRSSAAVIRSNWRWRSASRGAVGALADDDRAVVGRGVVRPELLLRPIGMPSRGRLAVAPVVAGLGLGGPVLGLVGLGGRGGRVRVGRQAERRGRARTGRRPRRRPRGRRAGGRTPPRRPSGPARGRRGRRAPSARAKSIAAPRSVVRPGEAERPGEADRAAGEPLAVDDEARSARRGAAGARSGDRARWSRVRVPAQPPATTSSSIRRPVSPRTCRTSSSYLRTTPSVSSTSSGVSSVAPRASSADAQSSVSATPGTLVRSASRSRWTKPTIWPARRSGRVGHPGQHDLELALEASGSRSSGRGSVA